MAADSNPAWLTRSVGPGAPSADEADESLASALSTMAVAAPGRLQGGQDDRVDSLKDAIADLRRAMSEPDKLHSQVRATQRPPAAEPTLPASAKPATEPADLLASAVSWDTTPPPDRPDRFLAGSGRLGMFPTGCVSGIYAPGGFTKTTLAASLAVHVAAGEPFAGLSVPEGASIIVSLEDGAEEMGRKLGAIAVAQFAPKLHPTLQSRVMVLMLTGDPSAKFTERYTFSRSMGRTVFGERLIATSMAHAKRCGTPVRLIVVDHARLAGGGDLNDSEAATLLLRELARVASETGAAVVLLGHSPKSSLSPNRAAEFSSMDALGSGAMVDNTRFSAVIFGPTEAERKEFGLSPETARKLLALRIIKTNYSEPGRVYFFRKVPVEGWDAVVPEFVTMQRPAPPPRGDALLDRRILDHVATRPGLLTANKLAKDYAGEDGPLQAGRPAITAAIGRLIASGRMATREPTPEERSAGNLSGRTREVLYVPD